jgi:hypothetical protein
MYTREGMVRSALHLTEAVLSTCRGTLVAQISLRMEHHVLVSLHGRGEGRREEREEREDRGAVGEYMRR